MITKSHMCNVLTRLQCDQGRPSCASCQRKEKNCTYEVRGKNLYQKSSPIHPTPPNSKISEHGNFFSSFFPTYREASHQPSPCPRQSSTPPHLSGVETCPSILWEDLELMRHFVTHTYLTCSCVPSIRDLWQTTIPKIASDYPKRKPPWSGVSNGIVVPKKKSHAAAKTERCVHSIGHEETALATEFSGRNIFLNCSGTVFRSSNLIIAQCPSD